jgi:hypothetical protein
MAGIQFAAGLLVAALLLLPLMKLYQAQLRWAVLLGGVLLGLGSTVVAARWVFAWNPIKAADQKSLDRELSDRFKSGVPVLFYEPDLRFLNQLNEKYSDSQADLSAVRARPSIGKSNSKPSATASRPISTPAWRVFYRASARRRTGGRIWKGRWRRRGWGGLDLTRAEEGLTWLREEEVREGLARNARKRRIQVTAEKTTRRPSAFSTKKGAGKAKPAPKTPKKKTPTKTRSQPAKDPAVWW